METPAITARSDADHHDKPAHNGKLRGLMTIDDLDGRTLAARRAKDLIAAIEDDMGGDITVSQRQLIQHAAILGAMVEDLATRWLLGEKIDQANYALLINAQRRVLGAL
jgi:hypothetical protein